ncbi:MAG TPA: VOC family protein, partial [Micromonosporaceae bacterium]|nr:VOC family protein [Micromonosporaceae bacterium]
FFVICLGAGMTSWSVAAFGIALFVLAITLVIVSAVRGGARAFVRGTAHVLHATEPPANTPIGRCELQIVVEAKDLAPAKVKIRDTRVPVAKWPDIGDTLPIRVAIDDPRHVRILWDEVRTHGEEAAEEERFHEYVQRIVDAELNGDPEPDDDPPPPPQVFRPATRPDRPRPSPRPRRPAAGSGAAATAVVLAEGAAGTQPADPDTEPDAAAIRVDAPVVEIIAEDEIPIHDIVPIEGASAVLGVPPDGDLATARDPAAADAQAVADLLAAFPSPRPSPAGTIHGVGVTLIVTDLARSIEFYRDMLGFTALDSGSSSAVLASGGTRIMLRAVGDMPKVDRRLVHLNLEVGDLDAVYTELLGKGVKFIHRPRAVARGQHMELWAAAFRDPDGHGIALIRWQPR